MAEQQPQEGIEVKTPGGWLAKLTGQNLFSMIVTVAITAGAIAMVDHRSESKAAIKEVGDNQQKALEEVAKAIKQLTEGQEASQYIFTLTPEERARLKLDMPASLRLRVR